MKTVMIDPSVSINEALRSLPRGNVRLLLKKGTYCEKVYVRRPNTLIEGEDGAVISYGDYAKKLHADGKEYNTFRTYTMIILADGVTLSNLTVENTAGNPKEKGQAVALSVYADRFTARGCQFLSLQDTVFNGPLPADLQERYIGFLPDDERIYRGRARQRFFNCLIAGSVDFIFGCGDAMYVDCEIRSLGDGRDTGYVAAPAHALSDNAALCFVGCNFTNLGTKPGTIFLARPWRDYGRALFVNCVYGEHISPLGFDKWNDTDRDKTARFSEYGAPCSGRVPWAGTLSENQANAIIRKARRQAK